MQFYENMNAPWEMILMHCEAFAAHGDDYLRVFIRHIGAIHKRRRQFFRIFDTPLPHVGSFLVLSVGNFDQFLTPPPSQLPTSFMDAPNVKGAVNLQ